MMNTFTKAALFICCLFVGLSSFAQTEISGKLAEKDGTAVGFANLFVKGSDPLIGTQTDENGNFSLSVPDKYKDAVIIVRFTGYKEMEVPVSSESFDIVMEKASFNLDKVIVTAGRRKERALDAPASVSLIEAKEIQSQSVATPSDFIANASGVDLMRTGLVASNFTIRGFNNIFSGGTLMLVDNRRAKVPSLRVNSPQMITTTPADIQRIEVLKGPASAMYGPNSTTGVVHIITESPLDMEERLRVAVSGGFGIRSTVDSVPAFNPDGEQLLDDGDKWLAKTEVRVATKLTSDDSKVRAGLKVSGKYLTGHDWRYKDLFEPEQIVLRRQTADGLIPVTGDTISNARDFQIKNYGFEGRLDLRFPNDMELVFAGGLNNFSGIELTGLGGGQGIGWQYGFGQVRFIWNDLFAQFYVNTSNSGDTYLLRDGNLIVDRSKFYNGQIQHGVSLLNDKLNLIYGLDALLTRPDTDQTIHGRFENDDSVNEYGAYVQAEYKLNNKFNFVAALRGDSHTFVDNIFLSPRAAIVFKPSYSQTFRLTFNRAFDSPSPLNASLDIQQGSLPTGIAVRGFGNRNGHTFSYSDSGLPQFRTPFATSWGGTGSTFYDLGDANANNFVYNLSADILNEQLGALAEGFGLPASLVAGVVENIVRPVDAGNTEHILRNLDLSGTANPAFPFTDALDPTSIEDVPRVKHSVTQTIEAGYKGIIKNKLSLTVDAYMTQITDFVSPLFLVTPTVFMDGASLAQEIAPQIAANMAANPGDAAIVNLVLDTAQVLNGIPINGNMDGDGTAELITLLSAVNAQVPFGTVNSIQADSPAAFLTYRNFGDVTIFGVELGAKYFVNEDLKFTFNYGFVNDEEFETEEGIIVPLNAPSNKFGLGFDYGLPKVGLNVGGRFRWQEAFMANSGVYVGNVPAFATFDLNVGYNPKFSPDTNIGLSVQNLFNNVHQEFAGAAPIGRFALLTVNHTFKVK